MVQQVQVDVDNKSNISNGSKPDVCSTAGSIDSLRNKVSKTKADFEKKFYDIK